MALPYETIPRPIILGIVGDSAAGKSTLSRGIARILGHEQVSVLCTDDYHRYNRQQRKELTITPLNPAYNYLDMMAQHLRLLRAGDPILKPHYDHKPGDFGQYSDLRSEQSHPLALTQLLLVYHLLRARQRDEVEV